VKVVSLKAENARKAGAVRAEFSDGSSLLFTGEYLPDWISDPDYWETGRELSSGEEEALRFAASCYRAETHALRLIARAEQNSLGLTVKLERRGHDAAAVNAVISCLRNRKLLDDRRYAQLWIRSRLSAKKAFSPKGLLVSLGKRGIRRDDSLNALGATLDPETEYALLLRYLERDNRKNSGISEKKRKKFLKSKIKYEGFSSSVLEKYFNDQID